MILDSAEATFIYHATLINGGYSYRRGVESPRWGYLVGGLVPEMVLPLGSFTPESLVTFTETHLEALLSHRNAFLGTWLNPGTERVHVDLSQHVMGQRAAASIATIRNQLAVWDVHGKTSISV